MEMEANIYPGNTLHFKLAELALASKDVQEIAHISSQTEVNVEALQVDSGTIDRGKDGGNYVQNILSSQNKKPLLPANGINMDQVLKETNESDFIHKPTEGKQNVSTKVGKSLFGEENKFTGTGRKSVGESLDKDLERPSHHCEDGKDSSDKKNLGSSKVSNLLKASERELYKFGNLFDDSEPINIEGIVVDNVLAENILSQIEYYFSDFNLLKNNFILKCIKKSEDGFVSLRMISTFRKIRLLTKDVRVVAYSLMQSASLELNDKKSKIRRKVPVPKIRDTYLGKTIVVFNIPPVCQNDKNLYDLFSKFGSIVKAEIMTIKSNGYHVYHRRCLFRNNELYCKSFGVIEFERYVDAIKALKDDNYQQKENQMKVVPLTIQIHKNFFRKFRSFRSNNRRANRFRKELQRERRCPQNENDASAVMEDLQERPNKMDRGYRRYSNRQYSRNRAPYPGDTPRGASEKKLSPEAPVCCEMRRSYNRSRQMRTNNMNSKPMGRNRSSFENTSPHITRRVCISA